MRAGTSSAMLMVACVLFGMTTATVVWASTPSPSAPAWVDEPAAAALTRHRHHAQTCQRWRSALSRLGETYAGYKLRHTLVTRTCALGAGDADEQVWGWPWRQLDSRADLPPKGHGRFGAWEIRCGETGGRQRCALAMETAMAARLDPEALPIRIVAHLVIDNVAGRESVLWRVHVAPGGTDSPEEPASIGIGLPDRSAIEPFDACGRRGCMAEAEPRISAEVASTLWAGRTITISMAGAGTGRDLAAMLPSHGFRDGLTELIRLRRNETKAVAGR
jgi:invasion protein IalB